MKKILDILLTIVTLGMFIAYFIDKDINYLILGNQYLIFSCVVDMSNNKRF